jgi:hypothetical protein
METQHTALHASTDETSWITHHKQRASDSSGDN